MAVSVHENCSRLDLDCSYLFRSLQRNETESPSPTSSLDPQSQTSAAPQAHILSKGGIVGISVGAAIVLILLVIIIVLFIIRRRGQQSSPHGHIQPYTESAYYTSQTTQCANNSVQIWDTDIDTVQYSQWGAVTLNSSSLRNTDADNDHIISGVLPHSTFWGSRKRHCSGPTEPSSMCYCSRTRGEYNWNYRCTTSVQFFA